MTVLVRARNLVKEFPRRGAKRGELPFRAVDDVSFDLRKGSTLAIVGESGSGKSTTGRCALRLIEPTSGEVHFDGVNLMDLSPEEMRRRRRQMQIVFQDTYASLDPRWSVGRLLAEPLQLHENLSKGEVKQRVGDMLVRVGLEAQHADRYPHEFSGGQRQRIGIARALMLNPQLVVCDEPVSALDVSVQAQVLNLMKDLQEELGLSYIFISHDISVVEFIGDDIIVMNKGKVVEQGDCREVLRNPQDPYTRALLAAVPIPDPRQVSDREERRRIIAAGLRGQHAS
ncbi:ABC transporter ATP-binding protein [Leucobacter komagatae]|uniref:ABC transporter ATP-binding protein n=1 Tax=Leucobacter komagatae TaxID=55969 RepID=UPI00069611F5|nr:ATP-binding cassette domain-containing protein [Leucobacter komagatae]